MLTSFRQMHTTLSHLRRKSILWCDVYLLRYTPDDVTRLATPTPSRCTKHSSYQSRQQKLFPTEFSFPTHSPTPTNSCVPPVRRTHFRYGNGTSKHFYRHAFVCTRHAREMYLRNTTCMSVVLRLPRYIISRVFHKPPSLNNKSSTSAFSPLLFSLWPTFYFYSGPGAT